MSLLPAEQPLVDSLDKKFRDQGLVVLAVNVNESKKTVKKYLEQSPRACRIVLTDDTNLAAMYAANSYGIYEVIGSQRESRWHPAPWKRPQLGR